MPLRRGFIYLCSADGKRLAACAFRHKLSAFLYRLCCPTEGTLRARKAGWTSTQPLSAAQRYNTLDFVTKVVCHETLARFLWILPAQRAGRPLMTILSILLQDGLAKRGASPPHKLPEPKRNLWNLYKAKNSSAFRTQSCHF